MENEVLKNMLKANHRTLITDEEGNERFVADSEGVRDLNYVFHKRKELLENSVVYKDLFGGANAIFCILGGAKKTYAKVASKVTIEICKENNYELHYEETIPFVLSNNGVTICPIENASKSSKDLSVALKEVEKVIEFIKTKKVCPIVW